MSYDNYSYIKMLKFQHFFLRKIINNKHHNLNKYLKIYKKNNETTYNIMTVIIFYFNINQKSFIQTFIFVYDSSKHIQNHKQWSQQLNESNASVSAQAGL